MASLSAYFRPASLEEALSLLARESAVVIAGGTGRNAGRRDESLVAVDLQALGLERIEELGRGEIRIGAMATLQRVAEDERLPDVVREAARREAPSTLRSLATVGGCVAVAEAASEFLAALLVHDATIELTGPDRDVVLPLSELLSDPAPLQGRIVTSVRIEVGGVAAAERVARTRADRPIVAAVARRGADGRVRLALAGVASTPVLVSDPERLDPPGDHRGSSTYRRALATVLASRLRARIAR